MGYGPIKSRAAWIAITSILVLTLRAAGQELSEVTLPPNGDNQKTEIAQWISLVKVTIHYHSPHVHNPAAKDRTGHIWGELVPYGLNDEGFGPSHAAPWRAGANESTTITFSHDVKIEGKDLKAGTYALFLQVEQSGPWQWIFSTRPGWGSYQYDAKYDALRVPATPEDAPFTEFLTYDFDARKPDSAVAFLQWEKKRASFKIEVPDAMAMYVDRIREDLQGWPGFDYRNWQNAAQFCADNKINLEEALTWADKAISEPFRGAALGHEDFSTLQTKAAVLQAMGRDSEADALMQKAMHLPGTDAAYIYAYGMGLLNQGKKEKAMEVFLLNKQINSDKLSWTSLGLARGYTATNDKQNAIANWETVIQNVPESFKGRLPRFQEALKKLKTGT